MSWSRERGVLYRELCGTESEKREPCSPENPVCLGVLMDKNQVRDKLFLMKSDER
jgi:hypothetical protein